MRVSHRNLTWKANELFIDGKKVGEIVPDQTYEGMWRVGLAGGQLSDLTNISRAHDAVEFIARDQLEGRSMPDSAAERRTAIRRTCSLPQPTQSAKSRSDDITRQ